MPGRDHSPIQIYTHGDDQMDLMILGDVSYKHHAGHETGADWAAKMKLEKQGGEIKAAYYQIIVVSFLFFLSLAVGDGLGGEGLSERIGRGGGCGVVGGSDGMLTNGCQDSKAHQ